MKKTIKSTNVKESRKLIRSAAEDEDDEAEGFAPEEETDVLDDMGEDVAEDGETGFDIDEDIVDEINANDDFGGEELAKEDVIEAIKVIDEIATAVTEKEGDEVTMDADTVLNKVEEFTDDSVADRDIDDLDFGEDIPEELANSVVRVMVQDENSDVEVETAPTESIYTDVVEETPATVYDTDMTADDIVLDDEDDSEAEDDELLVVGNSKSTNFKKGVIRLNSSLCRKNPIAWKKAYEKVTSSLEEGKPMTSSAWALVQCLANAYDNELSDKITNVKRVVNAMKKSEKLRKMIQSELDASASNEFDNRGVAESETKPEETVGTDLGKVDENVGEEQSGEIEETFGDDVVSTSTEEQKEGEIADEPAGTIELLTLPINNSAQTIVLKKVGKNTFVGCGFIVAKDSKIKLVKSDREVLNDAKADESLVNALDGKVVALNDGTAVLLKSSNIYGLLACHANFIKGIKGAKYEVFKKIGSSFVSANGVAITSSCKSNFIISSSASNKSAKKTNDTYEDVFASLEKTLHKREIVMASMKARNESGVRNVETIKSENERLNKQVSMLSSMLRRRDAEIKRLTKLSSGTEAEIRAQIAERDRENLFASSQKQLVDEQREISSSTKNNVNNMAKLMGRMF